MDADQSQCKRMSLIRRSTPLKNLMNIRPQSYLTYKIFSLMYKTPDLSMLESGESGPEFESVQ